MKRSDFILPFAALAMIATPFSAMAQDTSQADTAVSKPVASDEASIPFANHGGVWDWRAKGTREVYFQDSRKQWYRATLMSSAFDLPYVEFIGIDASPGGSLDKWSAIYVKGQRYTFASFEKVDGPPTKKAKQKAEEKAAE
ncbi:hypothetical protein MB02_11490 [Croceicoccus estronivorus]|uniref:DUF6491 family protein n=1 Tax=Croceicoccus estronivorus TaxID=1172626 RepID=UPI00082E63CE|nr:DUF6491 family protein [Croceicoccus estronivorus]OCC23263.1 hypothetical protein MB02_11490 [Croceicoccus estronivorus]